MYSDMRFQNRGVLRRKILFIVVLKGQYINAPQGKFGVLGRKI